MVKTLKLFHCCFWPIECILAKYFCLSYYLYLILLTSNELSLSLSVSIRFVSDYALNGFKALCQHKLLQAMQKSYLVPEASRTYPLSLLEWTATRKKAHMVLQVHCFDGKIMYDKQKRINVCHGHWTKQHWLKGSPSPNVIINHLPHVDPKQEKLCSSSEHNLGYFGWKPGGLLLSHWLHTIKLQFLGWSIPLKKLLTQKWQFAAN